MPFAAWAIKSLTVFDGLLALSGLVIFVGACVVVAKSRRPAAIAAYTLFVPLPFVAAVAFAIHVAIFNFWVVGAERVVLIPEEVYEGVARTLLRIQLPLLTAIPAYSLLAVGLFVRSVQSRKTTDAAE